MVPCYKVFYFVCGVCVSRATHSYNLALRWANRYCGSIVTSYEDVLTGKTVVQF